MTLKDFLFSKKYNSLYYFFKTKIPFISPDWYIWNFPYYQWWKARKVFKRPKVHFAFSKRIIGYYGLPIYDKYYNKILDIRMSSLGYKTKYSEFRHEWDPYISIIFFKKYHFLWTFNWIDYKDKDSNTSSMATWEAILDYVYYKYPIDKVIKYHTWKSNIGEDAYDITIKKNLK